MSTPRPHVLDGSFAAAARLALGDQRPDLSAPRLALLTGHLVAPLRPLEDHPAAEGPAFGQDAVAELILHRAGVHLRDLHPPDAAVGLHASPEFALHFADSYHPLLLGALAHGQPVLAWQGCGEHPLAWGVIRRWDAAAGQFDFTVPAADGRPLYAGPLTRPAVQCYALEAVAPQPLDDADLLTLCAEACRLRRDPAVLGPLHLAVAG